MKELPKQLHWLALCLALAVILIGALRIHSTLSVFSSTPDEPHHLAGGMEWLVRGTYSFDIKHPPLGRVAAALPLWLSGSRTLETSSTDTGYGDEPGKALLSSRGRYAADLAIARSGVTVFFVLMCAAVFCWSWELFGPWVGLLSLVELSLLPAVLAHSGFVTTDMAGSSTLVLSLWMLWRWSRRRTLGRAIAAGLCVALALLGKLSSVPFLLACAMVWLALQVWMRRGWPSEALRFRLTHILVAALSAFLLIWAAYRFHGEPLSKTIIIARYQARLNPHSVSGRLISGALDVPIPGGNLVRAVGSLLAHEDLKPDRQYFLGEKKEGGWLLYFPVAFLVKAPLPFLILSAIALLLAIQVALRRGEIDCCYPAGFVVVLFLVCLPTQWNIGTRYLLSVYPLLCVASGLAIGSLWNSPRFTVASRVAVAGLLLWLSVESIHAHPDYLAYFNQLARSHPERILADSDLDWGQDLYRLRREVRAVHAGSVWTDYFGVTPRQYFGFESRPLPEEGTVSGWVAVSLQYLLLDPERHAWLAPYSWRPVGKSMRLYYVPEPPPAPSAPPGRVEALTLLQLR